MRFPKRFCILDSYYDGRLLAQWPPVLLILTAFVSIPQPTLAYQVINGGGAAGTANSLPPQNMTTGAATTSDGFNATTPVLTFHDNTGQFYGRYIVNEAVPTLAYGTKRVTERVWLPKTVTEQRTVTQVQYTPVYVYQPQLRNVYGWNPFASPQQVWQYVPVVQYQPTYTQVNQPVTFVRYEEQNVEKVVPELQTQTRQVGRFADRPMAGGSAGSNTVALNNVSTPMNPIVAASPYQQNATFAQANRNTTYVPTRPIDPYLAYGYQSALARNMTWNVPQPYYLNAANAYQGMNNNLAANSGGTVNNVASNPSTNNVPPANPGYTYTTVVPMVAANSASAQTYPVNYGATYPPWNNYTATAALPKFQWPSFTNGTGTLFGSSLFGNNRSTQYVASNPWASPYGANAPAWSPSNSSPGFRPNTSPIGYPQNSWGVSTSSTGRDMVQGGMAATELR